MSSTATCETVGCTSRQVCCRRPNPPVGSPAAYCCRSDESCQLDTGTCLREQDNDSKSTTLVIVVICAIFGLVLLLCICTLIARRCRQKDDNQKRERYKKRRDTEPDAASSAEGGDRAANPVRNLGGSSMEVPQRYDPQRPTTAAARDGNDRTVISVQHSQGVLVPSSSSAAYEARSPRPDSRQLRPRDGTAAMSRSSAPPTEFSEAEFKP